MILWCIAAMCGCALQQDVVILDERLTLVEQRSTELDSRLDMYSKSREKGEKDIRTQSAGQNAVINSLREEIRILRGRLEEQEYLLNQRLRIFENSVEKREGKIGEIDQVTSLNKDRIVRLEQYLNFESTESDLKPKENIEKKPASQAEKELSEDGIYKLAKQAFDQGDFEAARNGFNKILKRYPKSGHADNAQFWIGETYYREKWYEKAILEYQKVIEKYPKGNKVPASLLKQGFAFYNLGDKANSRLILTELVKKHPKSNESKIARQKLKEFPP